MKGPQRQAGMTGIGWLIILSLIGFFAYIAIRLFPVYYENFAVRSSLESAVQENNAPQLSNAQLRRLILNRLDINNVETVNKEHITIEKLKGGGRMIHVTYSVKVPLMSNISAMLDFDESAELDR